jgi:hypothetical protein
MELVKEDIEKTTDELELMLGQLPQVECPLIHIFTPGLYTRQIFMPADSLIISKIHKFEHPFVVSKGIVWVRVNDDEWERIEAPYTGITHPGTRRRLYTETDCIWTTFHVADEQPEDNSEEAILAAVERIEDRIIEKHLLNAEFVTDINLLS